MIYDSIGGWFQYEDVYRDAVKNGKDGDVFVELGTYLGKSAAFMAELIRDSGKKIKFYTVDNHKFYRGMTDYELEQNGVCGPHGHTYEDVVANLEPLKGYVEIVVGNSWDGIPGVDRCDFCWVDASHEYESCHKDLVHWLPRSKIIGGDDFGFSGVRRAVEELAPKRKVIDSIQNPGQQLWILNPNPYYRD